jgi:hypothetical protein
MKEMEKELEEKTQLVGTLKTQNTQCRQEMQLIKTQFESILKSYSAG